MSVAELKFLLDKANADLAELQKEHDKLKKKKTVIVEKVVEQPPEVEKKIEKVIEEKTVVKELIQEKIVVKEVIKEIIIQGEEKEDSSPIAIQSSCPNCLKRE